MTSTTSSRNQAQKVPFIQVFGNITGIGNAGQTVIYTVPVGKKAQIIDAKARRDNFSGGQTGVDELQIRVKNAVVGFETVVPTANDTMVEPLMLRQTAMLGSILEAGETISAFGENGTSNNGAIEVDITIQESPA